MHIDIMVVRCGRPSALAGDTKGYLAHLNMIQWVHEKTSLCDERVGVAQENIFIHFIYPNSHFYFSLTVLSVVENDYYKTNIYFPELMNILLSVLLLQHQIINTSLLI